MSIVCECGVKYVCEVELILLFLDWVVITMDLGVVERN